MARSLPLDAIPAGLSRDRRMARLRRLSRGMAMLCVATAALLAAGMLAYWATTPAPDLFAQAGLAAGAPAEVPVSVRATGFALSMIPLCALGHGLLSARRCFRAFARGEVFCAAAILRLRTFALAIAAAAVLKPFTGAALSLLLSSQTGGPRTLAFHVGSDTLLALIFAGTVAVIAWVMAEALAIADENRQFV